MGAPPRGGEVSRSGLDDLVTFNRWLCLTRLRAAGAVIVFTLGLRWLGAGNISSARAFAVCAGLFAVSGIGLSWRGLMRAAGLLFYLQSFADLAAITVGLGVSVHGVRGPSLPLDLRPHHRAGEPHLGAEWARDGDRRHPRARGAPHVRARRRPVHTVQRRVARPALP